MCIRLGVWLTISVEKKKKVHMLEKKLLRYKKSLSATPNKQNKIQN